MSGQPGTPSSWGSRPVVVVEEEPEPVTLPEMSEAEAVERERDLNARLAGLREEARRAEEDLARQRRFAEEQAVAGDFTALACASSDVATTEATIRTLTSAAHSVERELSAVSAVRQRLYRTRHGAELVARYMAEMDDRDALDVRVRLALADLGTLVAERERVDEKAAATREEADALGARCPQRWFPLHDVIKETARALPMVLRRAILAVL